MTGNHYQHLMFGSAAKARQRATGSYQAYGSHTERPDTGPTSLDTRETAMIRAADQFYVATTTETGWPYVQYRSGPAGFLQVIDNSTLGFADFAGNNQFVTAANLDQDDRLAMILVDYPRRQRLKLYGRARVVERDEDPGLLTRLMDLGTRVVASTSERSIVVEVEAFDWNCTRSIIPRYDDAYVAELSALYRREADQLRSRIADLEAQLGD
ncbi:putative pyridoxine 5-phosphate oxidase [Rhodococcoides trifolii]|uniref:Pyridoxine 5-phosphate oxidase n=1 Tax=Rhodococcoides trifolii TaxID=908250 RepID=A0A917CNG2_9NOCA|nr:pyridoxamine 5'-phosphate oxidase family protein [Rhodococcus trifolii]GGF93959.1 putative pyridoxine 5-phosphate oxidase [Rhodococcus trifolii]